MKRFIIWIVLCISILIALGSLSAKPIGANEINYHDSYLGAIHFNEYGVSNKEPKQQMEIILSALSILLLSFVVSIKKFEPNLPKTFLFHSIRTLKLHENLIPKIFHSNLFVQCSSKITLE